MRSHHKTPVQTECKQCGGPMPATGRYRVFCSRPCRTRWQLEKQRRDRASRPKAPYPGKTPCPIRQSRIPLLAARAARGESLFPLPASEIPNA